MLTSRMKCVLWLVGVVGVLSLLGAAVALLILPAVINAQVLKKDVLGMEPTGPNGTLQPNDMTAKWIHPPYDMRLHIWMYSVQNEAPYLAGKEKLKLLQKGPYVFVEDQEKEFYKFVSNDTRVLYRNTHRYFFNQSLSCAECQLSDKVTIPNVIYQKLVDIATTSLIAKGAIETVLFLRGRESPFITVSVGEALFDGYDDPLLSAICTGVVKLICDAFKIPPKIGLFYGQNNTNDGLYEVGTGLEGAATLGHLYLFNNRTSLPDAFWDSLAARMINGTDGQLFPPMLKKSRELSVFASQACRSVRMAYKEDSEYQGVWSWRYSPPDSLYDPSLPDNRIFCHNDTPRYFSDSSVQLEGCLPAGMLDLSHCQPGQPRIYLSQAHFLNSPKQVWEAVEGLDAPSADNDLTYVDIEPTSGVPIWAKRVMQVNVGMLKGNLNGLAATRNIIVPVFWVNETASFDDETRAQLKDQLQLAKRAGLVGGLACLVVGLLLVVGVVLAVAIDHVTKDPSGDQHPLISEETAGTNEEADTQGEQE